MVGSRFGGNARRFRLPELSIRCCCEAITSAVITLRGANRVGTGRRPRPGGSRDGAAGVCAVLPVGAGATGGVHRERRHRRGQRRNRYRGGRQGHRRDRRQRDRGGRQGHRRDRRRGDRGTGGRGTGAGGRATGGATGGTATGGAATGGTATGGAATGGTGGTGTGAGGTATGGTGGTGTGAGGTATGGTGAGTGSGGTGTVAAGCAVDGPAVEVVAVEVWAVVRCPPAGADVAAWALVPTSRPADIAAARTEVVAKVRAWCERMGCPLFQTVERSCGSTVTRTTTCRNRAHPFGEQPLGPVGPVGQVGPRSRPGCRTQSPAAVRQRSTPAMTSASSSGSSRAARRARWRTSSLRSAASRASSWSVCSAVSRSVR